MGRPDDEEIRLKPMALVGLMLALAGGNAASLLYTNAQTQPDSVRPDPFTGSMGAQLESRMNHRIEQVEREMRRLQDALDDCMRKSHG